MEQVASPSISVSAALILNEDNEYARKTIDRKFVNIESHQLVWLALQQQQHNSVPIETLREIIDYTKLFQDPQTCETYIQSSKDITTFLIIFDEINLEIFLRIHNLKQVFGIYLHNNSNEQPNNECIFKHAKVKYVSNDITSLLVKLKEDVQLFFKQEKNVLISTSNLNSIFEEEKTHGDSLSWWSVFLDLLLYQLPYPKEQCLEKLYDVLTNYYTGNRAELNNLVEFKNTYKMEDAIKWYTRETFIYRLLNKAFRQHNIIVLILFGFYIQDMYVQLQDEYENFKSTYSSMDKITVYRGQTMWKEEIDEIRNGYNKIVNWCFFSTTHDRSYASIYLNDLVQPTDAKQNVLFEIQINYQKMSYPYADISYLSYFPSESEILFMTDEDRRKSTERNQFLINDTPIRGRSHLKTVVRALLQRFDSMPISDMNIIFNEIFELFPNEKNWLMAVRFHCLANHEEPSRDDIPKRFQLRANNYYKALTVWREYKDDVELNCHVDIGDIHCEIAECYLHYVIENFSLAKAHYEIAMENYTLALECVAIVNNEKTLVYEKLYNIYKVVLEIDKLDNTTEIFQMIVKNREDFIAHLLKSNHPKDIILASSFKQLADLYKSMAKNDQALINYKDALELYQNFSSPDHNTILHLAKEIVDIYINHQHDPDSALQYQEIIRNSESEEEVKFGQFTPAMKLPKSINNEVGSHRICSSDGH